MIVEGTREESMRSVWELYCNAFLRKPRDTCFITSFSFFCVSVIVEISVTHCPSCQPGWSPPLCQQRNSLCLSFAVIRFNLYSHDKRFRYKQHLYSVSNFCSNYVWLETRMLSIKLALQWYNCTPSLTHPLPVSLTFSLCNFPDTVVPLQTHRHFASPMLN